MADKRLSFRFRFPWRNNPRPTEEPNSRPPFRPAGKAPVKASPSLRAQPPQKTHNIPVSTSPAATEILVSTSSAEKPIKNVSASESRISIQKMISSYSSTGEQAPPNKEIRQDVSKVDKLATGKEMLEKPSDVVTLAGENNGANMHLSSKPGKREETLPISRNYKLSSNYSTEATTDGDVSRKEEISNDHMSTEDQQSKGVYINSNVQSINNSVVFNTSVTERNPGVSMFSKSYDKPEPLQTHKAEILQTPADKYTHQSTVRRRCLRGLFMESSDSEPDNPAKPRRHGCRYVCGKDRKETDIGIV